MKTVEIEIADGVFACKIDALREENERLRKALLYIAYEHVLAPPGMAENHLRETAREALAISKIETTTREVV